MTTTSRSETSFSQLLLNWVAYRLSQAVAAVRPAYRADEIAAAVATNNNPPGA